MKLAPSIKKETGHIAVGVLAGDAIMLVVFALLKKMDYTVLLGALLGSAAAIGNFLLMGIHLQRAMSEPERAKLLVHKSYTMRMLGIVAVMIIGFLAPCFQIVAVVVPFLLPSVTIKLMQLTGRYQPGKKGGEEE